jgi:hypothetical protein
MSLFKKHTSVHNGGKLGYKAHGAAMAQEGGKEYYGHTKVHVVIAMRYVVYLFLYCTAGKVIAALGFFYK